MIHPVSGKHARFNAEVLGRCFSAKTPIERPKFESSTTGPSKSLDSMLTHSIVVSRRCSSYLGVVSTLARVTDGRFIHVAVGKDGAVEVIDWADTVNSSFVAHCCV